MNNAIPIELVGQTIRQPTYSVLVDMDNDGVYEVDITDDVDKIDYVDIDLELKDRYSALGKPSTSVASITLFNEHGLYSPNNKKNIESKHNGKFRHNTRVRILAGFIDENNQPQQMVIFTGVITNFRNKVQLNSKRMTLTIKDFSKFLQKKKNPNHSYANGKYYEGVLFDATITDAVNYLLDYGLGEGQPRTVHSLPVVYPVIEFNQDEDIWSTLQKLAEACSANMYFEGEEFRFLIPTSQDYTYNYEQEQASFTRASTAYKKDGSEVASGVVRYEDTPFGKGIMVEEGTTNRNRDPFLSDINKVSVAGVSGSAGTKEEVPALMYGTKAVKVTCTNAGIVRLYDNAPNFTWTRGETAAVSCIVAVSKPSLISNFYLAIRASYGAAITTTVSQSAKLLYDNVYLLTGILTLTSSGLGAAGLQFNSMQPGDWFIVDAWQSEQKSYPTSITSGTRQPEVVTIKHGLTPEQGTIEGIFEVNDLSKRQISGHFPRIFGLPIVGDNDRGIGFCHAPTSAEWWFQVGDADGTDTVNIPDSLTPNGFYRYRVTWTSALARIELFSLATKQRVATASIANPKLPSAFAEHLNIGGTGTAATACSNTIHADIRCSSIARTDTEYGLDAPLPVDEWTTAKVGFDGELTAEAQILKVSSAYTADSDAVSYVDLTHFRVAGDKTGTYTAGAVVILEYGYNDLMEATVISSAFDGANTTVECTGPVPSTLYSVRYGFTEPKEHDRFWFGESTTQIKPYRIINIKRTDDLKCSITALEYNEAVYAEVEVPEQDTSTVIGTVDVNVSEHIDPLSKLLYLDVSWTPPREYFGAIIEINGRKVKDASINETSFSMPVDALGTYAVKVTTLDFFRVPFAVGEVFYETVYTPAPPKPDGLILVPAEKGFRLVG